MTTTTPDPKVCVICSESTADYCVNGKYCSQVCMYVAIERRESQERRARAYSNAKYGRRGR